jgi:hypothetical protein
MPHSCAIGASGEGRILGGGPAATRRLEQRDARSVARSRFSHEIGAMRRKRTRTRRTVEAERFVLKDELGNTRASLSRGDKGPTFSLFTDQEHPRLSMGAGDYGPYIQFFEPHTETMIELSAPYTSFEVSGLFRHRGLQAKVCGGPLN